MKAITIWQPWASYIVSRLKHYKTRSWSTPYRGLIAIHAAKRWTDEEQSQAESLHHRFPQLPKFDKTPPLGVILCIVRLVAVHRTEAVRNKIDSIEGAIGGYADGRYAWELRIVEVFDVPILAKGQQGLWDWEFPEHIAKNRIAIVGSRKYDDLDAVTRYVNSLPPNTTIISGGAKGVDQTAEAAARARGLTVVSIPVDKNNLPRDYEQRRREYGRRAMQRNGDIIELAGSVTAFWYKNSAGTRDSIKKAEAAGKLVSINPTEEIPQKVMVQLTLSGFANHYDEGEYISILEKAKKIDAGSNSCVDNFEWSAPWKINDTHIWTKNMCHSEKEGRYQDGYKPVPIDSDDAKKRALSLSGYFYTSETLHLRQWLDEQLGWQPIPYDVADVGDLPVGYFIHSDGVLECVPMNHIVFTQETYNVAIAREYWRSLKIHDENGNLPFGIRFSDSPRVYLLDGHHRSIWQRWRGRSSMLVEVNTYPETFAQSCGFVEDEDEAEKMEFYADILEQAVNIIREGELSYV